MLTTICCRGGSVKIHQLQALVASAETGSIRAAARSLGISQAAVTRALRELEATEQLPLLIRAPGESALPTTARRC
ncbi:LysR family transcriptional regulator [Paraburkholderia dipogonis]|uniref:helix-turn-helix domain-containing protein n=1 Tax=Paraburkholderia dipogonis TaxID=1211383 RepID=UPI00361CD1AF